jgi:serine/threonine-protein kinase RsbT
MLPRGSMQVLRSETVSVASAPDVVMTRQLVRTWAVETGFGLVDQTKIITAASELARNTVQYGRGGTLRLEMLDDGRRRGLRLTFADAGPGIPNLELAMRDGYTTGNGLGLGLSGSRRLMNEFSITSEVGQGTTVVATRWKP